MHENAYDVGVWVLIAVLLLPAAKVIMDWVRPQRRVIDPQPFEVRPSPTYQTTRACERMHDDLNLTVASMKDSIVKSNDELRKEIKADMGGVHHRIDAIAENMAEMRGEIRAMFKRGGGVPHGG